MSHRLYDFLAHSEFFDERFLNLPANQIKIRPSLLENYVQHCIDSYNEIVEEITSEQSKGIRVFENPFNQIAESMTSDRIITQSIIQDLIVIPDPLFSFIWSLQNQQFNSAHSQLLGLESSESLKTLQAICRYMKSMAPFIAEKIVKFHPDLTKISSPGIPFKYSPNSFADGFEESALKWLHSKAKVSPMRQDDRGFLIEVGRELTPCRSIYIEFDESDGECNNFYNLFEQRILNYDEKTGKAEFAMHLPKDAPSKDVFQHWVTQSINQSGSGFIARIKKDIFFANRLQLKFAPQNAFIHGLITQTFSLDKVNSPLEESTISPMSFLLRVPISSQVEEVLKARSDTSALIAFRAYLQSQFAELSTTTDKDELNRKSRTTMDELNRKHLPEVKRALANLKAKEVLRWSAIAAGCGASYLTLGGSATVLAGLGAVAEGLRATRENMEQVKSNPGYFWSKITKE